MSTLDLQLLPDRSFPFASLIVFFGIYAGIINNRSTWSRYVRFNAMQVGFPPEQSRLLTLDLLTCQLR